VHHGDYRDPITTLAEDVVNSYRHSIGSDELDRESLTAMARARGWRGPAATAHDVAAGRALRPALREIFESHSTAAVNTLLVNAGLVPQLVRHDDGPPHIHLDHPEASLPDWVAGNAAYGLSALMEKGEAARLHRCLGTDCYAVFVDLSRNHSRVYCSPSLCANRSHVAAHRARRAASHDPGRTPPDTTAGKDVR
jgi:predicted RNA-binding Zn ribbon-like protein